MRASGPLRDMLNSTRPTRTVSLGAVTKVKLAEKRFDHLVMLAPPSTLGDLRKMLPKSILSKVTAELAQDLVKTPQSSFPGN